MSEWKEVELSAVAEIIPVFLKFVRNSADRLDMTSCQTYIEFNHSPSVEGYLSPSSWAAIAFYDTLLSYFL